MVSRALAQLKGLLQHALRLTLSRAQNPNVLQVIQAEADDAAGKALARAVYRAFSDVNGAAAPDSNPLLRRNKLSASNPLL